jgi:hypothetical protein
MQDNAANSKGDGCKFDARFWRIVRPFPLLRSRDNDSGRRAILVVRASRLLYAGGTPVPQFTIVPTVFGISISVE